jgi:hypothetical protein
VFEVCHDKKLLFQKIHTYSKKIKHNIFVKSLVILITTKGLCVTCLIKKKRPSFLYDVNKNLYSLDLNAFEKNNIFINLKFNIFMQDAFYFIFFKN